MRRHPKALPRGPRERLATRPHLRLSGACERGLLLFVCLLLVFATSAQTASAGISSGRQFLFSFNGGDAGAGPFGNVRSIAVDQASGAVYVTSEDKEENSMLEKFHPDGTAWNFSATGTPVLFAAVASVPKVAVENSGGTSQGQIYVTKSYPEPSLSAYDSAGALLWKLPLSASTIFNVAVDGSGHPWVVADQGLLEYANTGSPPAMIQQVSPVGGRPSGGDLPWALEFDSSGNAYIRWVLAGLERYPGGDFTAPPTTFDSEAHGVYVDRTSPGGHIFTGANASASTPALKEYDSTGTLLEAFGQDYYDPAGEAALAYDNSSDRVYVGQRGETFYGGGVVAVFGPPLPSGTVPDATVEAATGVAVTRATLHGKVNPQGVPGTYRFEWKATKDSGREKSSWASARSTPPFSLPEDSIEHGVEYAAKGLSGNTTYQFRLVTENTEKGLSGVSAEETVATPPPASAPVSSIDAVTATTTTAHIRGTIDPEEDTTTWRLQKSTDPNCATGFTNEATHTIPAEEPSSVAIEADLSGLLPAQHYCVRIEAENSLGSAMSAVYEFTTDTVLPTVVTAFAAPRTETTARINARVNPQGAPLVYRFEYSADGGSTWIVRPSQEDLSDARDQIVVSDDLTGLAPGRPYLYRVVAENSAGEADPQGKIKEFATRTSGEMTLPGRGLELINNPDKGNQNVAPGAITLNGSGIVLQNGVKSFASDGNRAFWSAPSGIPGGTAGVGNPFVATRTATGWHSENLLPPGDQLEGDGDVSFTPVAASSDLSRFLLRSGAFIQEPSWYELMRIDLSHDQERLAYQPNVVAEGRVESGESTDTTTDLQHVVRLDLKTGQLVDVGTGTPEVVSLMPDGSPANCRVAGFFTWTSPNQHWIATTDGSRVFFLTQAEACSGNLSLFVRNRDAGVTTEIAAGVSADAQLVKISPDGQAAIFLSKDPLVEEDENEDFDIYRWREGQGITCLSCVVPDAGPRVLGTRNAVLASEDLSHVYFESNHQLVPGLGAAGQSNLYVLADGTIRFVAETQSPEAKTLQELPEGDGASGEAGARLSKNGNVLVFTSSHELTSDRLGKECVAEGRAGPCTAIYRYDDRDGSLECISCRPNGVTEANDGTGEVPDRITDMSADGETIAFTTRVSLLPTDVNNGPDVYVWSHGALGLITDGVTKFPEGHGEPSLVGVDESGADIFFTVAGGKLTGFEDDGLSNYYDARIGGGFAPPEPAAHCQEESCQGPLQPAPSTTPALSAGFRGYGNVPAPPPTRPRCQKKKGQAKRRCMRANRKHKHGKRRHKHGRRTHHKHAQRNSGTGK